MRLKHIIALLILLPVVAMAQFDPSAQKYLDQLAETVKSTDGLTIDFEATVTNTEGDEEVSKEKGTLSLKDNYHVLKIADTETFGDEENQWIYYPEVNEVTIQPIEKGELTPASIFTIYKEGYRFRIVGEEENKVAVELSSNGIQSNYVRITLYIDTEKGQLDAFSAQGKNGIITNINITGWEIKALANSEVRFEENTHPDVDIIDLR